LLVGVTLLLATASQVQAAKTWKGNPSPNGTWTTTDGTVWNEGAVPGGGDTVYIQNGGTCIIDSAIPAIDQLYISAGSTLAFTTSGSLTPTWTWLQTGGKLDVAGYFSPNNFHIASSFSLTNSTADLNARYGVYIGEGANATVTQTAGTFRQSNGNQQFQIGVGAAGIYNHMNGTFTLPSDPGSFFEVGYSGPGAFLQSGGAATFDVTLIGKGSSTGLVQITGGSVSAQAFFVGDPTSNAGTGAVQVVGSGATSITLNGYWWGGPYDSSLAYFQSTSGVLDVSFDAGGITPINVSNGKTAKFFAGSKLRTGLANGFTPDGKTTWTVLSAPAGLTDSGLTLAADVDSKNWGFYVTNDTTLKVTYTPPPKGSMVYLR